MIDFGSLDVRHGTKDGFVGIRESRTGDGYEFCVPCGFEKFPTEDYADVRDLFFKMYRTFKKFERESLAFGRADVNDPDYQRDEDQTTFSKKGVQVTTKDGDKCVLYSKIRSIEEILSAYSDLALKSVQKKHKKSSNVDYSKVHKYLDKAVYLSNDAIYVKRMEIEKPVISKSETDLVGIYCFILNEIVAQLDGDVQPEITSRLDRISRLADKFAFSFLKPGQSLFDSATYDSTMSDLRDALSQIHRDTAYRDAYYWDLYEAVEAFLYGEIDSDDPGGDFWGIKGFGMVWEDICQTYFFEDDDIGTAREGPGGICFADTDVRITDYNNPIRSGDDSDRVGNYRVHDGSKDYHPWIFRTETSRETDEGTTRCGWNEIFCIEYPRGDSDLPLRRFPSPDIVLEARDGVQIYDFKYVGRSFFKDKPEDGLSEKFKSDLKKQFVYEYAAQQYHNVSNSVFIIPKYEKENREISKIEDDEFADMKGVEVFGLDFEIAVNRYTKK